MTTFGVPSFTKNDAGKVSDTIEVRSEQVLVSKATDDSPHPAIAARGFPADRDGTYVFVTDIIRTMTNAPRMGIGFTSTATRVSTKSSCPGTHMNGIAVFLVGCSIFGGNGVGDKLCEEYLNGMITCKAKEIISILTISNKGAKKEVQFIVDGNAGPVHECDKKHFENGGSNIFPVVTLCEINQQLEFISFDQVMYRSPKIDELRQELNKSRHAFAPSTSTAENDALIAQLREATSRSQDALIQEKDDVIRNLRELLSARDQQLSEIYRLHRQHLDCKDQQLGLERAEHQKTRNYLHQIRMEMKDMEIFFLKESGQRREREEEFEVKIEPVDEEEEAKKKSTKKKTANKKK